MNLKRFLKQTATLERHTGRDPWGKDTYDPPVEIPTRSTKKLRTMTEKEGTTVVSVTEHMTNAVVEEYDKINGEQVRAIEELRALNGSYLGCIAYPRPPLGFSP